MSSIIYVPARTLLKIGQTTPMTTDRPGRKNGNAKPLGEARSFTPEEVEEHRQKQISRMARAIESLDGWPTFTAYQLAEYLVLEGAHPPLFIRHRESV